MPALDETTAAPRPEGLLLTLPILARMEAVESWFSREEGDRLIAVTARALTTLSTPHHLVEIGSYCGRSTVALATTARAVSPGARVHAIDPHEARSARLTVGNDQAGHPMLAGDGPANGEPVLVSCIMPTFNRRQFVPRAIDYFLRQDYPNRELVVIDDGSDPVENLIPDDRRIRYVRLSGRRTIGAERNIGCEQAVGGVLMHWDDDDWVSPWRMRYQVEQLEALDAEIVGLDTLLYFDPATGTG